MKPKRKPVMFAEWFVEYQGTRYHKVNWLDARSAWIAAMCEAKRRENAKARKGK